MNAAPYLRGSPRALIGGPDETETSPPSLGDECGKVSKWRDNQEAVLATPTTHRPEARVTVDDPTAECMDVFDEGETEAQ